MTPFDVLGLTADDRLTDDDIRAAWRRIAAATHPDRADGGDPEGFAEAAAAYTALRTAAARTEVLAELRGPAGSRVARQPVPGMTRPLAKVRQLLAARIGQGRPLRLAARLITAATASALAVATAGWQPASLAVSTGALTWLALTAARDLGRGRRD
ncbi:MAG TPA: DnaJ domain-containing protein [Streptosporangiaceae bacterium]|nr:DnaJ domain-containing protein [Streptosporangiaceae bacterium]